MSSLSAESQPQSGVSILISTTQGIPIMTHSCHEDYNWSQAAKMVSTISFLSSRSEPFEFRIGEDLFVVKPLTFGASKLFITLVSSNRTPDMLLACTFIANVLHYCFLEAVSLILEYLEKQWAENLHSSTFSDSVNDSHTDLEELFRTVVPSRDMNGELLHFEEYFIRRALLPNTSHITTRTAENRQLLYFQWSNQLFGPLLSVLQKHTSTVGGEVYVYEWVEDRNRPDGREKEQTVGGIHSNEADSGDSNTTSNTDSNSDIALHRLLGVEIGCVSQEHSRTAEDQLPAEVPVDDLSFEWMEVLRRYVRFTQLQRQRQQQEQNRNTQSSEAPLEPYEATTARHSHRTQNKCGKGNCDDYYYIRTISFRGDLIVNAIASDPYCLLVASLSNNLVLVCRIGLEWLRRGIGSRMSDSTTTRANAATGTTPVSNAGNAISSSAADTSAVHSVENWSNSGISFGSCTMHVETFEQENDTNNNDNNINNYNRDNDRYHVGDVKMDAGEFNKSTDIDNNKDNSENSKAEIHQAWLDFCVRCETSFPSISPPSPAALLIDSAELVAGTSEYTADDVVVEGIKTFGTVNAATNTSAVPSYDSFFP